VVSSASVTRLNSHQLSIKWFRNIFQIRHFMEIVHCYHLIILAKSKRMPRGSSDQCEFFFPKDEDRTHVSDVFENFGYG